MIQISFGTQYANIKKFTIRNPRQNTQLINDTQFSKYANPFDLGAKIRNSCAYQLPNPSSRKTTHSHSAPLFNQSMGPKSAGIYRDPHADRYFLAVHLNFHELSWAVKSGYPITQSLRETQSTNTVSVVENEVGKTRNSKRNVFSLIERASWGQNLINQQTPRV